MKKSGQVNETEANLIFDTLVEHCGANESNRDSFVYSHVSGEHLKDHGSSEFRFMGKLGFGGKFRINSGRFYVDYYQEDETSEIKAAAKKTNESLMQLLKSFKIES
jgi:hypothetical protein